MQKVDKTKSGENEDFGAQYRVEMNKKRKKGRGREREKTKKKGKRRRTCTKF